MNAIIAQPGARPRCSRAISAIELRAVAHRGDERREVVHRADEHHAEPIQSRHGSQPNVWHARIGPAMGPAAAIAEKCCPEQIEGTGRDEVDPVVDLVRGGRGAIVELELARHQPP